MLQQITIQNFAIIDRLQIDWMPGLNVITGETGAGKSILIDAVGALLGDRLGPEVVRSGASRALVEGVFVVEAGARPELQAVLDAFGLEAEDGALIVSREIVGSDARGRGGARVNGRGVPLSVLQELGELLVDVHGQSQHMALLRAREQLDYLDHYAGVLPSRAEVQRLVRELRGTRDARLEMLGQERETARLADMLRHEISEIDRADLRAGEEEELLAQRTRLQHVERLRQAAQVGHDALAGQDANGAERPGAIDLLAEAVAACQDGARFDPALAVEGDALNGALAQAEESARVLRGYLESIEADPAGLERAAERLFLIGDLKRKYGESVLDVLSYADDARERLDAMEHRTERLAALERTEQLLTGELSAAAQALSGARRTAATRLSEAVEVELGDLRLGGTRFRVALNQLDDPDGIAVDGRTLAFDGLGIDRVEFLIAVGADDEPRALARVASGGELARIALALKTILSRAETRPTLIFDEIDVGVGGRTAPVVGEKLYRVSAAGHQVLCVTHMPQVAAFGDAHYVVVRSGNGTTIAVVNGEERVEELASMLAGTPTDAARASARELLARAQQYKTGLAK